MSHSRQAADAIYPELLPFVAPGASNLAAMAWGSFLSAPDGDSKFLALRHAMQFAWPEFVESVTVSPALKSFSLNQTNKWNPWLERNLRAFTNTSHATIKGDSIFRSIALTGCAAAGKTHAAGAYAVSWWLPSPQNSIAILTSTTVGMIRHRIWPVISHYALGARDLATGKPISVGHMVDSQLTLKHHKGDDKHAIFALAIAHGETQKALHNLKGMHAERILLVIDEANGTPEAIFSAIPNLRKGCKDFTLIVIGNPCARFDPHGRCLAPEDGWSSLTEDLTEWRTKPVSDWQIDGGLALRFDGRDSPNVKLGENRYPYLYTTDNWLTAQEHAGTLQYWSMDRGLHPPEGFSNTIFNEQLLLRCDAEGHFTFDTGQEEFVAFLDPAFGGDACILQFGRIGLSGGRMVLQLLDWLDVPISPDAASHDIDYQIARRIQQECITRRVKPQCFGLDATGIGRGVGAILAAEWSSSIHYMQWGGSATDRASAQNDGRPARECYSTFVTELWFSVREGLEAGQIKGFSRESMMQACARQYEVRGKRYHAEPKPDMKARVRYSPDHFDAVAGLWEIARRNGITIEGKIATTARDEWLTMAKQVQRDSSLDVEAVATLGDDGGWSESSVEGDNFAEAV